MNFKLFAIIIFTSLIFLVGNSFGQSTVPPEDVDESWEEARVELDHYNLRAARDYQDFMDRLEKVLTDYYDYFAKVPHLETQKLRYELNLMVIRINKGVYCSDHKLLAEDLVDLIEEVDFELDDLGNTRQAKKIRELSEPLRRDLELYAEELSEDLAVRLEEKEVNQELLEEFLMHERSVNVDAEKVAEEIHKRFSKLEDEIKKAMEDLSEAEKGLSEEDELDLVQLEELLNSLVELKVDSLGGRTVIILPSIPDAITDVPEPPEPSGFSDLRTESSKRIYIHPSGKPAVARQIMDSIAVRDSQLPVYIKSETGDVRIEGWDRNWLSVQFDVEVLAESERSAKEFTEQIELKMVSNAKGVFMKSHFPSLSDPKRKVLSSSMLIYAPENNPLVCDNSFGSIDISDLTHGVRVSSNYCEVVLEDIDGGVEAANKMGRIELVNSTGTIQMKNNLGPITVTDCDGDMDVENAYAPVRIFGCNGPLVVRNTGQVEISDHNGNVDIENSNGIAEITDLTGDLTVRNSFRPLVVSDIVGSVTVNNTSAPIEVEDIQGRVVASNKYGPITAQYLSGPVELIGESGRITLVLDEEIAGPSSVKANFSLVNLTLSDESNVFLTATTDGGTIKAGRDYGVVTDDRVSMAKVAFGNGSKELSVSGTNTTIVINDE